MSEHDKAVHFPASEAGKGLIPENEPAGGDVHRPASESDTGLPEGEDGAPGQSWPGGGGPGTFLPPG
jgi:hypothetical protein